jgi:hypothetical protein
VAEAGFMVGMERNADVVELASYAPLLVNSNWVTWLPDMIVFDNHRRVPRPAGGPAGPLRRHRGAGARRAPRAQLPCSAQLTRALLCRAMPRRLYGIPSYWVQSLFAQHQGTQSLGVAVQGGGDRLVAGASCMQDDCAAMVVKVGGG